MFLSRERFAQCRVNSGEYAGVISIHGETQSAAGQPACNPHCSESSGLRAFSRIAGYLSGGDRVGAKCAPSHGQSVDELRRRAPRFGEV